MMLTAAMVGAVLLAGEPVCTPFTLPPHMRLVTSKGEQLSFDDLSGSKARHEVVYIKSGVDVKYAEFMTVLNHLQDCGIFKISLITEAWAK